ncbi:hypothetical protein NM74_08015 [Aeromonas hydrophila]|uniref:hypothetical protein n=1 Tax=Aeromonas hydrophila TaxID=644 RepID=UPI0005388874|nr:hypothetical protein [Aeromonas hydrophila]KHA57151.1 hypothetical protein NM74_08015 [Aeromonas hydrophila]
MEITANHVNVEQLVAMIEARTFPIGVDFTDPLAQRLYDAMSVLMCHASVAARQASIARRYITTRAEMEISQGGCNSLKQCLEEMNAQEQGKTAPVVLRQQYQEELNDVIPAAKAAAFHLKDFATNLESIMPSLTEVPGLEAYAKELEQRGGALVLLLRDGADLLEQLMDFNVPVVEPCKSHGSERGGL